MERTGKEASRDGKGFAAHGRTPTLQKGGLADRIGNSELMATQRRKLQNLFGNAVSCPQLMSMARTTGAGRKDQLATARNALGNYIWSDLSANVATIDGDGTKRGISDQASHSEMKVFVEELTANNAPHTVTMLTERPPCQTAEQTGCYDYFTQYSNNHAGWDFDFFYLTNPGNGTSKKKQLYDIYRVAARNPRIPRSDAGDHAH